MKGRAGEPWYHRYKPKGSVHSQLLLAAIMWSAVGLVLLGVGLRWTLSLPHSFPLVVVFVALGLAKARFVLIPAARRAAGRIESRGRGRCLGGFFSLRSWLLVGIMAGSGRLLRAVVALGVVGLLYLAVGAALAAASAVFWTGYAGSRTGSPPH